MSLCPSRGHLRAERATLSSFSNYHCRRETGDGHLSKPFPLFFDAKENADVGLNDPLFRLVSYKFDEGGEGKRVENLVASNEYHFGLNAKIA